MTTILSGLVPAAGSYTGSVYFFAKRNVNRSACIQCVLTYGSGGTSADFYVQTSLNGGGTWVDMANFHYTTSGGASIINLSSLTPKTTQYTPTNKAISANSSVDGIIGDRLMVSYVIVGSYSTTTVAIDVITDQLSTYP